MSRAAVGAMHDSGSQHSWPAITPDEAQAALRIWDLPSTGAKIAWRSERPLSAAAIVSVGPNEFFVKRHHATVRTPAQLREEHAFIEHLASRGAPVNLLFESVSGETAVSIGDFTYEIQRRAPGVDLYRERASWTPFRSVAHARAAGKALARLHRASRGFHAGPRESNILVASYRVISSAEPIAALGRLLKVRPGLQAYLHARPWTREIARALEPFHAQFIRYAGELEPLWTHNDWHASNLFWSNRSGDAAVSTVVDFGLCDRTTAVYDIATAIERNTIPWIAVQAGEGGRAELPLARAIIDGYLGESDLDPRERAALVAILPLVHVEYALSEIEYFDAITDNRAHADLAYEAFLLGHCEWFTTPPGRELLENLRNWLS